MENRSADDSSSEDRLRVLNVSTLSEMMRLEVPRDLLAGEARRERVFKNADLDLRFVGGGKVSGSIGRLGSLAPGRVSRSL